MLALAAAAARPTASIRCPRTCVLQVRHGDPALLGDVRAYTCCLSRRRPGRVRLPGPIRSEGPPASWSCIRAHRRRGHGTALLAAAGDRAAAVLGARRRAGRARLRRADRLRARSGCCGRCAARSTDACPTCRSRTASRVRAFRPGHDEEAWLGVNARAFADHPEQGRWTARRPASCARPSRGSTRPGSCSPSTSRTPLLGFHWTKVHPAAGDDPAIGEIYVLGVDPGGHRSGLGAALSVAGLRHLAGSGPDRRRCCTWTSRTPPRWRSTGGWASRSTRPM